MISRTLEKVLNAPAWLIVLVTTSIVFAEDALFVGFVIPGETAAILGGVAASLGRLHLWLIWLLVVLAAVIGDSVGYEVGRHFGPRVLRLQILHKHRAGLDRAQDYLRRRGAWAVFLGRWTAFFRAVMPALAGMSRMHYPTFLTFNAAGGVLWGSAVVWAGYLAGRSYHKIAHWFGTGGAIAAVVLVLLGVIVWRVREHRQEDAEESAYDREHPEDGSPAAARPD